MLRKFAWDIFEETGNPEAYLFYKELRGFEEYADEGELLPEMRANARDYMEDSGIGDCAVDCTDREDSVSEEEDDRVH